MSRYFPHTPYAEDQPLSHTILTTHVLTRAVTTGAVLGTGIYGIRQGLLPLILPSSSSSPSSSTVPKSITASTTTPFQPRFFRATGITTLWTLGIVSAGLIGRMWGREAIEWQDRSWRLMEHRHQLETDDWTYGGMAAGAAAVAARVVRPGPSWVGVLGVVGMGSLVGVAARMGYRYGLKGGIFDEEERKGVAAIKVMP
ncbi:hypothetical protein PG993_010292 [Apiospora rasikravindrae]|uniref:Uncharacterized protein n=1 Tax=Apiospora rasikravindrae TaxID=990691 RepID=A0ABR1SLT7_9PEZI